ELYIDGELCNDKTPKDRDIAMVFQSYALYPHMSVYDNMAFGLKIRHMPKNEIDKRVHAAAKILQIEEFLDRKPKALSGGQRQRVALGRAIVRNAKVFLMDEPLSNLDAKLRVQMRSEIIKLHDSLNATTIYVTHDQTEAMTMATRIVVMKLGRVQQIGSPIEIYNKPNNLFVAGFIGSPAMNFFDVKFNAGVVTFTSGEKLTLPKSVYEGKEIPEDVILGIRPEDISRSTESEKETFEVEVRVAELLGHEYYVHADFGGSDLISKFPAEQEIKLHQNVFIKMNGAKVHFFSKETEERIK
ncbi:MAG: ATP-binding cassette domain-containing protein, partial [Bacilli bacterium]